MCIVYDSCHFRKYPLWVTPSFLCILKVTQKHFTNTGERLLKGFPMVLYVLATLVKPCRVDLGL
jgi:hypothetical protein